MSPVGTYAGGQPSAFAVDDLAAIAMTVGQITDCSFSASSNLFVVEVDDLEWPLDGGEINKGVPELSLTRYAGASAALGPNDLQGLNFIEGSLLTDIQVDWAAKDGAGGVTDAEAIRLTVPFARVGSRAYSNAGGRLQETFPMSCYSPDGTTDPYTLAYT